MLIKFTDLSPKLYDPAKDRIQLITDNDSREKPLEKEKSADKIKKKGLQDQKLNNFFKNSLRQEIPIMKFLRSLFLLDLILLD